MIKYIYKTVGLLLIFVGALFFFGSRMSTNLNDTSKESKLQGETFPYITLTTQGQKINTLYGYGETTDANVIRETVTPLNDSKTILLNLSDAKDSLTKISYRILDKESGEVYDEKEVGAVSSGDKTITITFDYSFKTSTEYILDLVGTASSGRKIHYYTRLKYYLEDSHLADKLAFARKFHKATFQKSKQDELEQYLEPSSQNANSTLAKVDITSSSDLVTYSAMAPKVISEELVSVKEYNMETACIQYNYFVKAATASGSEIYHMKEFYRVRYAGGHDYLLNFERTMEAEFNPDCASPQTGQLKLGITQEHDSRMLTDAGGSQLYFERGGSLYCYDMKANQVVTVYSSFGQNASYAYKAYNEQDIRLLKVDDEGNLYFCVYGYFPRGEYEGDVAVVLYEYTKDKELKEMVYMPANASYQQLKEDFASYGYVSPRGIYYFTVGNTVYAYNMSGKRLEKLAENIKSTSFMTMEKANCYVWSSSMGRGYGDSLTIYNLENDEKTVIPSEDKNVSIRLLGVIEGNVVFGRVRNSDIVTNADGSKTIPCYQIEIADTAGQVKKTYTKDGQYVQSIRANGNVINMKLCKKSGASYTEAGEDSILTATQQESTKISYESRVTSKSLTEWYIQLPSSFTMEEAPKKIAGPSTVYYSGRYVRLEQPARTKYYVSALGRITASYESARAAIKEADRQMGVVISSKQQIVWERSGSFLMNNIGGLEMTKEGNGVSNLGACAYMILKQNHFTVDARELSAANKSIYEMLASYMPETINLKGCTLEQVLYFVSNNKAVAVSTGTGKAVVISGYTSSQLYLFNPEKNKEVKVSRSEYEKIFKQAGNQFVSYMED